MAITAVSAASAPAQWAMTHYFEELAVRLPEGFDPGNALEEATAAFGPPRGLFLLAVAGGEVLGCGALQHLDDDTAEVKRMWVSPSSRRRGVGRRLLARLEDEARLAGRTRVVLDTNGSLTEALSLYRRQGYTSVARYNDNPCAQHWFAKALPVLPAHA